MNEHFRNNYFTVLRIGMLLLTAAYTLMSCSMATGVSARMLLLLALYAGVLSVKELFSNRAKAGCFAAAAVIMVFLFRELGYGSLLPAVFTAYEFVSYIRPKMRWYYLPLLLSVIHIDENVYFDLMVSVLICVIYIQHDHVVEDYRRQNKIDTIAEQSIKHEMKAEMQKNLLIAENQMLEERTQLSQTLHDKLGHNINGSVYQLEAVKVIMEKDPEKAKNMIQAVIDQLRGGMDEIRAILRKKRPDKHKLALSQLESLCDDCRKKGIDAVLVTEGDLSCLTDSLLEVMLDNCYEAVSNSLKYSNCTRLRIEIQILNKMVRCTVTDNGRGCADVMDGMGLSGMRRRTRRVNGVLDIESEMGFTVNMLLPL